MAQHSQQRVRISPTMFPSARSVDCSIPRSTSPAHPGGASYGAWTFCLVKRRGVKDANLLHSPSFTWRARGCVNRALSMGQGISGLIDDAARGSFYHGM